MIYTLIKEEDYKRYLVTSMTQVQTTPGINQWMFNNDSGAISVNGSGSLPFIINVPIRNLNIGDKVKIQVDVKLNSGVRPILTNSLGRMGFAPNYIGSEGTHRLLSVPRNNISDFQTISLEFVYEGYQFDRLDNPSFNSNGVVYVRFAFYNGFGAGNFEFKDFKIETQQNISGLYPGTRLYYGRITLSKEGVPTLAPTGNSNNFEDLTVTVAKSEGIDEIRIVNKLGFFNNPTTLLTPYFQNVGNVRNYELSVVTSTTETLRIRVYDIINSRYVTDFSTLTADIFSGFMWLGE